MLLTQVLQGATFFTNRVVTPTSVSTFQRGTGRSQKDEAMNETD